jgi:hypothetical protein
VSIHLNDANATVARWRVLMNANFGPLYTRELGPLPTDTNVYGPRAVLWQQEYERRTNQAPDGVVSDADLSKLSIPSILPIAFTVEGHASDMFSGPCAGTAQQLEAEQAVHWEPTGYDDNDIPFNNKSGVAELARRYGQTVQDNGVLFPAGTKSLLFAYSQGGIVLYDFYEQYLAPGCPLAWRTPDIAGFMVYGNPERATNSCAPWSIAQASDSDGTGGLDPIKRWGKQGCNPVPPNFMDVWRTGDIFAQNTADQRGQIKASIFQAVARGDIVTLSGQNSVDIAALLVPQIIAIGSANYAELFLFAVSVIEAIISGISFLAGDPNAHYSPYDISGGLQWARSTLAAAA